MFNLYRSPFQVIDDLLTIPPTQETIYVVSDSQYKELKQKQAVEEISVLQKRLKSYESTAQSLRETITELQTEHGLLPEASE